MQQVFISYSRKDMNFVRKLAGDLEKAGYDVWWDLTDLRGGDDWVRVIPAAIESSQHFIIVLSPNSIESEWVRKEYTQALSLRKKVIPLMFEACKVPFALNTINYVNFASGEYKDNFANILRALGYTDKPPAVTPFRNVKSSLPVWSLYAVPAIVVIVILLLFIFRPRPETPSPTSTPVSSATATHTLEPFTETPSATSTASSSPTATSTVTITLTATQPTVIPSPTIEVVESLPFCVSRDIARQ